MNHLLPIPFFFIAIIVLVVSKEYKLKPFIIISKIVLGASVILFAYEYIKFLGYDIIKMIITFFKNLI